MLAKAKLRLGLRFVLGLPILPWRGVLLIHVAYLVVHSLAVFEYYSRLFLYKLAISGTRGSSGLGSVRSELIDRSTFEMVRAGDH